MPTRSRKTRKYRIPTIKSTVNILTILVKAKKSCARSCPMGSITTSRSGLKTNLTRANRAVDTRFLSRIRTPTYPSRKTKLTTTPVQIFMHFGRVKGTRGRSGRLKKQIFAAAKIMLKYMDRSADPCEDFYQFACGNWARHNPIPKDKAAYDTFEMIRESLDSVLKELLEDPIPRNLESNTDDAIIKAKHLFQSCMNYEILEQRMERPLIQLLDELGGWPILRPDWDPEKFDWLLLVAQLRLYNNDILISEWVAPDIKNSDEYVIQFDQTSLGLPTRDYFLQPSNTMYLKAYKNYLIKIATLLGASLQNATIDADGLIEFETKLAKITSSPDERRNVSELYQRMSIGELRTLVPQINWHRYLTIVLARPTNTSEPVVVYALQYIQDLVNLLSKTNPRTVANYLLWRFVRHRVNNLDDRFQEAKQKFYYILFGREQAPSRWKTCVAQVNSNMGMAVGSMFVKKYFDEKSKNDTLAMTRQIQRSFRELLNQTSWIDSETKELATEKVNAMLLRIGYPDFILQSELLNERYKDVVIRPDKYFENMLNILQHLTRVEQDRLGSPVNKTLWNTAPAVVNAYYSRSKNRIMFPAGILQPPFYHRYFPRSLNYGGIGVVIGHEITHGFDDKGRLFDKDGNLHRWWKDEAIYGFHQRAQCLIDQYSHYTVSEVGMQIDGVNTQGENIADNGGIKQAFRAYERWLRANGDADEALPGLNTTGKQLFFLNFAQVWCGSMRPEATRNKLKTAVHSPGKFRVIGTLSNSKDFAEVFNCPLGVPMNPVNKCSVW
ncbi:neprilysin-4 isoform X2 [Calliopsis andreniformis]|uniref:neprilysin-4 isoform X2 n=1 Tax=Calliopsis andreniformis TaxID=337506 RepID=UPI003FCD00F3